MRSKIIALILILMFVPLVSADTVLKQSYVYKQNDNINFSFLCFDENNNLCQPATQLLMSVTDPTGELVRANHSLTGNTKYFNVTLPSSVNGIHSVVIISPGSGLNQTDFTYLITPSGADDNSVGSLIFMGIGLIFSMGMMIFGFSREDGWSILFGSLLLFSFGLYILLNGFGNYRNTLTEATSLISLGIAGYFSIRTGIEMIDG